jgi:hypothetical protein
MLDDCSHRVGHSSGREPRAHRVDHRLVVLLPEDRAARDEGIGAGVGDAADVVGLDAAISFGVTLWGLLAPIALFALSS